MHCKLNPPALTSAEQFVTSLTMDSAPAMESPFQGELNSTAVLEALVKPEMLVGAV